MGDFIATVCFAVTGLLAAAAAREDIRTRLLRNVYTLPIVAIALLGLTVAGSFNDQAVGSILLDMAIGAGWFAGPWLLTHLIAPQQIGFGDIKLSFGLGLHLGWLNPTLGFLGFFLASACFGLAVLIANRSALTPMPFGPALLAGATAAAVLGIV